MTLFRRRKIIFCFLLIVLFGLYYYQYALFSELKSKNPLLQSDRCDFERINYILEQLCQLYNEHNKVIGNFCEDLCNKQAFKLVKCYNNYDNNKNDKFFNQYNQFKVVLVFEVVKKPLNNLLEIGQEFVFKSKNKFFEDLAYYADDINDFKRIIDLKKFLMTYLNTTLSKNYEASISSEEQFTKLVEKLVNDEKTINKYFLKPISSGDIDDLRLFMVNLMSLLLQEEFVFTKYYASKSHILDIYGTCGHFYAIEKAKSLRYSIRDFDTTERKNLALKFLDLTEYFKASNFSNSKIQICDVKLDNFGINSNNELKLIDTDMVHLESTIFHDDFCTKHDDCDYFDCKSQCDLTNNKCFIKRYNKNLQVICEKIFSNKFLAQDGVISGMKFNSNQAKLAVSLQEALKKCSNDGLNGLELKNLLTQL